MRASFMHVELQSSAYRADHNVAVVLPWLDVPDVDAELQPHALGVQPLSVAQKQSEV